MCVCVCIYIYTYIVVTVPVFCIVGYSRADCCSASFRFFANKCNMRVFSAYCKIYFCLKFRIYFFAKLYHMVIIVGIL